MADRQKKSANSLTNEEKLGNKTVKIYSYVVDHDHGLSPNPRHGLCTLAHCKFKKFGKSRNNIVEMANEGDWILGTGGQSSHSAGNGKIIYLMRVDEKLDFHDFLKDSRFTNRADQCDREEGNTFALVSKQYYYFGRNALSIQDLPEQLRGLSLEKKGPNYRSDLSQQQIELLISWFDLNIKLGIHGDPCSPVDSYSDEQNTFCLSTCTPQPVQASQICKPNQC